MTIKQEDELNEHCKELFEVAQKRSDLFFSVGTERYQDYSYNYIGLIHHPLLLRIAPRINLPCGTFLYDVRTGADKYSNTLNLDEVFDSLTKEYKIFFIYYINLFKKANNVS